MTHPSDTEARARRAASGRALIRAIGLAGILAGIVFCALLFVVGFTPASDASVSGFRAGSVVVQGQTMGSEAAMPRSRAPAWTTAEIDDVSGDPRVVEPAPAALPRLSGTGFRPRGDIAPSLRASAPPDRPPRQI